MQDRSGPEFQDITAPDHVDVHVRNDGTVLWIHVNGMTVVRICRIKNLVITDERKDRVDV